jgi:hypothetical protein
MVARSPAHHEAGIIGRTLRLMLGLLLGWMTVITLRMEHRPFHLRALAVLGAVTLFYLVALFALNRYGARLNRWNGALLALAPFVVLFAFGGAEVRVACAAYGGLSMLLQTLRADDGCEVLSIPTALLRRRTRFAGILFAPIDLVEKHLTGPGGFPE